MHYGIDVLVVLSAGAYIVEIVECQALSGDGMIVPPGGAILPLQNQTGDRHGKALHISRWANADREELTRGVRVNLMQSRQTHCGYQAVERRLV